MKKAVTFLFAFLFLSIQFSTAQHSIARQWNEITLDAIRGDFARPTVHARNLFHVSVAMYDAWAVYEANSDTYFLGKTTHGFTAPFDGITMPDDVQAAQEEAISYAVYRLMRHRFLTSPGGFELFNEMDAFMTDLGYDTGITSLDYQNDGPAALGNYLAQQLIAYGIQDGSNEQFAYQNLFYETINDPLVIENPGNPDIGDYNRWQPLTLDIFIDQSGNQIPFNTPDFLSPEWGQVSPFSLQEDDATVYVRDMFNYVVYHDPGPPAYLDVATGGGTSGDYQWGHSLVSVWSSHLDPIDGVVWDISPASNGNIKLEDYPTDIAGLQDFYNLEEGGDPGTGYDVNPVTGEPYTPQYVPRGDYARVLAEFWADGPDSETPPGHWFTIINYVNDHPLLVKKFRGVGEVLDDLEWDVKSYLTLGGAMHDVAITAWGIKGWYDYIRPVSAIRAMADLGQSTSTNLPSYHPGGIPLVQDKIELVTPSDPLAGPGGENAWKIKVLAWRGPDFVANPNTDEAGVGWILAENWWPYQRPSFVTPPFAGYVSGHSTYSRAAAEVLTALTGDPFFPGGMGEFHCPQNEFLVFEDGPSVDVVLQWATYRDASDQCSLSRIWGGIHPPVDDIPGRLIGIDIGVEAFNYAERIFYKDEDMDGFLSYMDCDDSNADFNPDADEICDEADNNCDGVIDEGFPVNKYYFDFDEDGFGDAAVEYLTCLATAPVGYVDNDLDCDDTNGAINPDAVETCDGLDNDCNGLMDDGLPIFTYFRDNDGDGFGSDAIDIDTCAAVAPMGYADNAMDCNDNDPSINPGMTETCDGIDNDCNGLMDDGLTVFTYYMDMDGDFFGDPAFPVDTCGAIDPNLGFVLNGYDCDDTNPDIHPAAPELEDGIDNDCNGIVDDVNSTDEVLQNPVRIFPNPTNGHLTIEYEYAGRLNVQLFHANGQLMKNDWLDFSAHAAPFNVDEVNTGIYYLVAVDTDGVNHFVAKVVRM